MVGAIGSQTVSVINVAVTSSYKSLQVCQLTLTLLLLFVPNTLLQILLLKSSKRESYSSDEANQICHFLLCLCNHSLTAMHLGIQFPAPLKLPPYGAIQV